MYSEQTLLANACVHRYLAIPGHRSNFSFKGEKQANRPTTIV